MVIRIRAKECCGGICDLEDAQESNIQEETECCDGKDSNCCHEEWADD
jgi:hypothetical protein